MPENLEQHATFGHSAEIYYPGDTEHKEIIYPGFEFLPVPLMAFHKSGDRFLTAPVNNDRILSARLGLEIVRAESDFRLFDPKKNEFLRSLDESDSELARLRAEIERLKAEK